MRRTDGSDGGSAFPALKSFNAEWASEDGMSLRDYFAAKVAGNMMALAADDDYPFAGAEPEEIGEAIAKVSYAVADAMLAERSK